MDQGAVKILRTVFHQTDGPAVRRTPAKQNFYVHPPESARCGRAVKRLAQKDKPSIVAESGRAAPR
jgi:hypothetical protein